MCRIVIKLLYVAAAYLPSYIWGKLRVNQSIFLCLLHVYVASLFYVSFLQQTLNVFFSVYDNRSSIQALFL